MVSIGLLMGIWNEADRIVECLDYHLPFVDEAVIVIQKSDDGTEKIVDQYVKDHPKYKIQVLHFPKMGFSEATLQDGADALTSDWILYVDADELFPEEVLSNLHVTLENTEYDGFWFERDNYFDVQIYNDAQPGMEPQVMRIKHPKSDQQSRLSRKSLSKFYRQIHVRVRILREDGSEHWGKFDASIFHLKKIEEQWQANRDYAPAVKLVNAVDKLRKGEFITPQQVDNLYVVEDGKHIPFEVKRVFWIYGTRTEIRGMHGNRKVNEVLFCIQGSVEIGLERRKSTADHNIDQSRFVLDSPLKGLFIPKMSWIEITDFKEGTILLCLASEPYDEADYLRDHAEFIEEATK